MKQSDFKPSVVRKLPSRERVLSEERDFLNQTVNTSDINSLTINVPERLSSIQHIDKAIPINKVKRPDKLNPVAPPRRDASNSLENDTVSVNGSVFSISNSAHGY